MKRASKALGRIAVQNVLSSRQQIPLKTPALKDSAPTTKIEDEFDLLDSRTPQQRQQLRTGLTIRDK